VKGQGWRQPDHKWPWQRGPKRVEKEKEKEVGGVEDARESDEKSVEPTSRS
jgi:hypothetical protein